MNPVAHGLAWHLWRRHRMGLLLVLAYLLVEVIAATALPDSLWSKESVAVSVAIPLTMIGVYLIAIFINPDADFAVTASGYPSYLLTLPVRTRDLALWPMLYGAGSVALVWLAGAGLVLIPRGIPAPLWWPAAMMAALLACLQAIIWYPIPLPYLRAVLAVVLLPVSIIAGVAGYQSGVSEGILTAGYLSLIPLAFMSCLSGLSRVRNDNSSEWSWIPERMTSCSVGDLRREKPFVSPGRAQLWLEWRRNGIILPIFVGAGCAIMSLSVVFIRETTPVKYVPSGAGSIEANACVNVLFSCLGLPLWLGMVIGSGARKADTRLKDLSIHPFLATRPISSMSLVGAKLKMAALSTLAAWAVLLGFMAFWLMLPAKEGGISAPLGSLLARHLTLNQVLIGLASLGGLMFLTWKSQIDSLYIDLSGRKWLVHGFPILFSIGVTILLMSATPLVSSPDLVNRLIRLLPAVAVGFAGAKLLARGCVLSALVRSRLITIRVAALCTGVWVALGVLLFAAIYAIVPSTLVPAKYLFLGVFLALPFARLGAAPLALEWNRHR